MSDLRAAIKSAEEALAAWEPESERKLRNAIDREIRKILSR